MLSNCIEKLVWVSRWLVSVLSGVGVLSWMCFSISPDPNENNKKQLTIDYR